METLDELKNQWNASFNAPKPYDEPAMAGIVRTRAKKHIGMAVQYFWASFVLQIIVYACLSHVAVRYWSHAALAGPAVLGIVLSIPFTWVLLHKFRQLAFMKAAGNDMASIHQSVSKQRDLLQSFFTFKNRYELFFIPLASAIGVWLVFELYVPGGIGAYLSSAFTTFGVTLVICFLAIHNENKKNFREPLRQLDEILNEYRR
jgi:small basic protein